MSDSKNVDHAASLKGDLHLPADKSISHRAAMFAALHEGKSTIHNFSRAADPHSTLECLRRLGVSIQKSDNTIVIDGVGREGFRPPSQPLDCGNSGTTMRLLSGIVGGAGVPCTLTGDDSLSARTMKRIINPLQRMGVDIEGREADYAPLKINRTQPIKALHFPLPIASAQLKSCVLLAGLFGEGETEVIETEISRDHTERLLELPVQQSNGRKVIKSSIDCTIPGQSYIVPGDFSAASFWLVAGSIHPDATITMEGVGMNPTRTGALDILQKMGADISIENKQMQGPEPTADIKVSSCELEPVDITADLVPNCIDEIPILMIAMLFADGVSSIHGAEELRHKETDRLAAMGQILKASGAEFEEHDDGFTIWGDPAFTPLSAEFDSEHDHRIAMSAAILSLMADHKSRIMGAECTRISYPSFWNDLKLLTN